MTDRYAPARTYSQRIVFFTKHKKKTLYTIYVIRALRRLGCTVKHINPRTYARWLGDAFAQKMVRRAVDRFKPDVVFVFSNDIFKETLEYFASKYTTAHLLDDDFPVDTPLTEKIKLCDLFFHTQKGRLEEYRAAGVKRPTYVPSGVDPDTHQPGRRRECFVSDVAFMGKAIYPDRLELLTALAPEVDMKVYGAGWQKSDTGITAAREGVGPKEFAEICTSAKIVLGIDKTAEKELYFSNRTWFALGSGGFLLTRYVDGLERVFANHVHLVWFTDPADALAQIRFYLAHDDLRQKIAKTGHEFVHRMYPNDRMAESMLRVLFEDAEVPPLTDPGPSFESGEAALAAMAKAV